MALLEGDVISSLIRGPPKLTDERRPASSKATQPEGPRDDL